MRKLIPMMVAVVAVASMFGTSASADTPTVSISHALHASSIESLVSSIRTNPADLSLRRQLAQLLIQRGLTVRAAETIRQVMAVAGQNADDLTLYGDASRYSGNVDGAIASYKGALTLSPQSAKAWSGLSLAYAAKHDYRLAEQTCMKAMSQIVQPSDRRELAQTLSALHASRPATEIATSTTLQ